MSRFLGAAAPNGLTPEVAELAEAVKDLQRNDPYAKGAWVEFCNATGGRKYDPIKHSAEFIQSFITTYGSGNQMPAQPGQPGDDVIAQATRRLQKQSMAFNTLWKEYCASNNKRQMDPLKHDIPFIVSFYDFLANQCQQNPSPQGAGLIRPRSGGDDFSKGTGKNWFDWGTPIIQPPTKMMRSNSGQAIATATGSQLKDALAAQVKAYQKQDENCKATWMQYCEQNLGGRYDPARHEVSDLQSFIMTHGVPEIGAGGSIYQQGPMGGNKGSVSTGNKEKDNLVSTVKAFQKTDASCKQAWTQYCDEHLGGRYDPARHEVSDLRSFIVAHGVPEMDSGDWPPMMGQVVASKGSVATQNREKDKLVNTVKAFQKTDATNKELWTQYCDENLAGRYDPARHEAFALQTFIDLYGVTSSSTGNPVASAEQNHLVARVKAFQKASPEQGEAWKSFCGPTKDPAKHDISNLQVFIHENNVPELDIS